MPGNMLKEGTSVLKRDRLTADDIGKFTRTMKACADKQAKIVVWSPVHKAASSIENDKLDVTATWKSAMAGETFML